MSVWESRHARQHFADPWGDAFTPPPAPVEVTDPEPTRPITLPAVPGGGASSWEDVATFARLADQLTGPAVQGILWCPSSATCRHPDRVRLGFGYRDDIPGEPDPAPVAALVGWLALHWGCRG